MTIDKALARNGSAALAAVWMLVSAGAAGAATPTVLWQTTDAFTGIYSADGSSILVRTSGGDYQMRRSSDGLLQNNVTPTLKFPDAWAFSPNKQYVAITNRNDGISWIQLWAVSSNTLARTINTGAVRSIKSLDISSAGLIQGFERFAYGGGGTVWVHRVSDGGQVAALGPYAQNSSPRAAFSPDGQYLALTDQQGHVVRVLRSSNWSTAFTVGDGAGPFAWAPNSASYWVSGSFTFPTPWKQLNVPAGTVARSILIDESQNYPTAVTPNGSFFLTQSVTTSKIEIRRTSDLGVQVSYPFSNPVYAGVFNPAGTQFTYAVCPASGPCTFYVAQTPAL